MHLKLCPFYSCFRVDTVSNRMAPAWGVLLPGVWSAGDIWQHVISVRSTSRITCCYTWFYGKWFSKDTYRKVQTYTYVFKSFFFFFRYLNPTRDGNVQFIVIWASDKILGLLDVSFCHVFWRPSFSMPFVYPFHCLTFAEFYVGSLCYFDLYTLEEYVWWWTGKSWLFRDTSFFGWSCWQ